jgi:hypothetical protein
VIRQALASVLLAIAVGACNVAPIPPATQTLAPIASATRTLEGLGVEFQEQPSPAGFDQEATLKRIRLEFGVGLDRAPDVVTYGLAGCIDPGCFGDDLGSGPLHVWLIEWEDDQAADSGVRLLVDAATGALIRFE